MELVVELMKMMQGVVPEMVGGILCGLLNPRGMVSLIETMLSMMYGMMLPYVPCVDPTCGGIRGILEWLMPGGICAFISNYLCYGLRMVRQMILEVICCK
ncbi:MAG: hypothetical protein MOIL_00114 [Candidatus Methanolliviera sp. GoM_oil]|nr:MAG: hypothetical protein MOIL_00114 [Candidatus Methanolliviera sp. GoM_oil]